MVRWRMRALLFPVHGNRDAGMTRDARGLPEKIGYLERDLGGKMIIYVGEHSLDPTCASGEFETYSINGLVHDEHAGP